MGGSAARSLVQKGRGNVVASLGLPLVLLVTPENLEFPEA